MKIALTSKDDNETSCVGLHTWAYSPPSTDTLRTPCSMLVSEEKGIEMRLRNTCIRGFLKCALVHRVSRKSRHFRDTRCTSAETRSETFRVITGGEITQLQDGERQSLLWSGRVCNNSLEPQCILMLKQSQWSQRSMYTAYVLLFLLQLFSIACICST